VIITTTLTLRLNPFTEKRSFLVSFHTVYVRRVDLSTYTHRSIGDNNHNPYPKTESVYGKEVLSGFVSHSVCETCRSLNFSF
jgi:hypothetical protein